MNAQTSQPNAGDTAQNFEAALNAAFGPHCGLNADWSVRAWCVSHSGRGINRGNGFYILDNEDGTLSLVARDFTSPNEPIFRLTVPVQRTPQLIDAARRIHEPVLTPARVGLVNTPAFACYLQPGHWNGYQRPYFTKDVGEQICAEFLRQRILSVAYYDAAQDKFVIEMEGIDHSCGSETINGRSLYPIGKDAWCWEDDVPTRAAVFSQLPQSKDDALRLMRDLINLDLVYHLDDDPRTIHVEAGQSPIFSEEEASFLESLVVRLNAMFGAESDNPSAINAGAWHAADLVNWGDTDEADEPAVTAAVVAQIRVRVTGDGEWRGTLGAFFQSNCDGLGVIEVLNIAKTLARGDTYRGGGGAACSFTIEPEPTTPSTPSAPDALDVVAGLVDEIDRCGVKVSPELEANARAALQAGEAAAPSLFAACEQAEHWLSEEVKNPGQTTPVEILRALRSAIEAATKGAS